MKKTLVILSLLVLAGCDDRSSNSLGYVGSNNSPDGVYNVELEEDLARNEYLTAKTEDMSASPLQIQKHDEPISQRIIRTANMRIQVEQIDSALLDITTRLPEYHARIEHSHQSNHRQSTEHYLIIRVPGENLDPLLEYIETQASYLHEKEVSSRNVTEEFIDIQSRLENKKQAEKRYREILQEARTVEEILKVENQLRVIREEIESVEGRLQYLADQTTLSTLHLRLYQPVYMASNVPGQSYSSQVLQAFVNGWQFFQRLVIGIVYIWPLWILAIIGTILIRRLVLKKQHAN